MPTHARRLAFVASSSLAASLLLAGGCVMGSPSADEASAADLAGRWSSRVDGLELDLRGDGSFTIVPPASSNRGPISGLWTEEGGAITFRNDADAAACPDVPGRYRWSFDEDGTLVFDLVSDDCPPRQAHMDDGFTRLGS